MPTENLSSNTEMVSVPRELAESIVRMLQGSGGWKTAEQLSAILAKPADQHQSEPVALPERKSAPTDTSDVFVDARNEGWNACLDETAKLGPLYTHADPGEVERLHKIAYDTQAALIAANRQIKMLEGELDTLRTQLAERDAPHPMRVLGQEAYSTLVGMVEFCLNKRVCLGMDEGYKNFLDEEDEHDFVKELRTLVVLSASAEPRAMMWACRRCHLEQPTGRPCDVCCGKTELVGDKS